jgi:ribosome maturation factor RimP
MQRIETTDAILEDIRPVIEGLGIHIVEYKRQVVKGVLHIVLVLYKTGGVTIEDCSEVHNTIMPRIEMIEDSRDVHLEVASPGIGRTLKSTEEFTVFQSLPVKILVKESKEWIQGVIEHADDNQVVLKSDDSTYTLAYDTIQKAKLV